MSTTAPAPWGSPPTPVLPRWYFDTQSDTRLYSALMSVAQPKAQLTVLGDLAALWKYRSEPLYKYEQDALVWMTYGIAPPPDDSVVVPTGMDTHLLFQCPIRSRTRNCIRHAILAKALIEGQRITVGQLLGLTNFGLFSLLDLMCVMESAIDSGFLLSLAVSPANADPQSRMPVLLESSDSEPPDATNVAVGSDTSVTNGLLVPLREMDGSETLGNSIAWGLTELTAKPGMVDRHEDISTSGTAVEFTLSNETIAALTGFWESLTSIEEDILKQRILAAEPQSLEQISHAANLPRKRVRQIEGKVKRRLSRLSVSDPAVAKEMRIVGEVVKDQLQPVTNLSKLEQRVSETFPYVDSPDKFDSTIVELARHLLRQELNYLCRKGVCIGPAARALSKELLRHANSLADELGLLNETELQHYLPHYSWVQHWDALIDQTGLHRLSDHLALRDTSKARTKAALLSLGRPGTKEEIGELSGLAPDRVGTQLSILPNVVRADKHRWGLSEWIEDEYEGIPAEILQRIKEDGGSTRLNRLLEELPRLFKISEHSVRAYLNTPAFRVEHGWVCEAETPDLLLGRLEDVIHGHDTNGDPYWAFEIEDHHLTGHSLNGVPPEVVVALGCGFGDKTSITVRTPANLRDVTVTWRKVSRRGPELGRLQPVLRALNVHSGQYLRLLIHSKNEVSFVEHQAGSQTHPQRHTEDLGTSPHIERTAQFAGVKMAAPIMAHITTKQRFDRDITTTLGEETESHGST